MGREQSGEHRTENHPEKLSKYIKVNNYVQQEKNHQGESWCELHIYIHI